MSLRMNIEHHRITHYVVMAQWYVRRLYQSVLLAVHVEESWRAWDDPHSFLEALNQETTILRKRVDACKSRVLIVTCFDSRPPGSSS